MSEETIVHSRPDLQIIKTLLTPGDYTVVPFEDSRCIFTVTEVTCKNAAGDCEIDPGSRIFSKSDGAILIGDSDHYLDRDFELVLQQMCAGEICTASFVYKNVEGEIVNEISCKIQLVEVTEEQLVSDWGWVRLYEAALHHKERGVELIKEKHTVDAFRRFSKALKFLIAIEPIDPQVIDEGMVKEMTDVKVKLYNNLAHCQLQCNEFEAAIDLCNRALKYDPKNIKALYRRCIAYSSINLLEEAWKDIQEVLKLDPNDKLAQQKASALKPEIAKVNKNYKNVIKKMFT